VGRINLTHQRNVRRRPAPTRTASAGVGRRRRPRAVGARGRRRPGDPKTAACRASPAADEAGPGLATAYESCVTHRSGVCGSGLWCGVGRHGPNWRQRARHADAEARTSSRIAASLLAGAPQP